jgi:NAD-dependent SIR2 family protein deacetylase
MMPVPALDLKYARCSHCKDFYTVNHMTKLECPGCTYRTFRCKNCGGADGAHRSIRAHYMYFKSRSGGEGGHRRRYK